MTCVVISAVLIAFFASWALRYLTNQAITSWSPWDWGANLLENTLGKWWDKTFPNREQRRPQGFEIIRKDKDAPKDGDKRVERQDAKDAK